MTRNSGVSRRLVPDLRISGHWIERAGFDRGQHYEIEVRAGRPPVSSPLEVGHRHGFRKAEHRHPSGTLRSALKQAGLLSEKE